VRFTDKRIRNLLRFRFGGLPLRDDCSQISPKWIKTTPVRTIVVETSGIDIATVSLAEDVASGTDSALAYGATPVARLPNDVGRWWRRLRGQIFIFDVQLVALIDVADTTSRNRQYCCHQQLSHISFS
jgi:hypothetical protein